GQDLPSLLAGTTGVAVPTLALALGMLLGLALLGWVLSRPEGRSGEVWLGGVGIGLVIAGVWYCSGVLGHVAEDPATLEEAFLATNSRRMESLSMVAPVAYTLDWLMFFSDQSKRLTLGIVSVVGIVLGSALAATLGHSFRWEGFGGTEDVANHLAGGLLMGVGGVTALGCTIGQGISGVSTLSLGSFIALAGIVAGAVLALRYQGWRLDRSV
ncbi:MAG: YeeE/YedE thiosulfate transporter family protein, partial [Burkholderiaceae bacterium]